MSKNNIVPFQAKDTPKEEVNNETKENKKPFPVKKVSIVTTIIIFVFILIAFLVASFETIAPTENKPLTQKAKPRTETFEIKSKTETLSSEDYKKEQDTSDTQTQENTKTKVCIPLNPFPGRENNQSVICAENK